MMYFTHFIGKAVEIEVYKGDFYQGVMDSISHNYIFLIPIDCSTTFTPIIPLNQVWSISEFPYFFT